VGNEQRPARVLEIDPVTDTVVATHLIPGGTAEGVRDVAIDTAKDELYVAYGAAWAVVKLSDDSVVRGPFAFSGNVRGLDVDLANGRVFGTTRGTGFDVMDASTGALIQTVTTDGANWRSHGIAWDPVAQRVYVSNSDVSGATASVRVYDPATFTVEAEVLTSAAPDLRSVAVDPIAKRLYLGHQSDAFDASGVLVLSSTDLTTIKDYPKTAYGNKVYGVSVDAAKGVVYVSARDRFPTGLIALHRSEK
jgi:DNA-binding beta-propeller fold protein YncE